LNEEEALEYAFKGALLLAGLIAGLFLVGILALAAIPFVLGYAASWPFFKKEREAIKRKKREERLAAEQAEEQRKKTLAEKQRQKELEATRYIQRVRAEEEKRKAERLKNAQPTLCKDCYLEKTLTLKEREELFARRYARLKISPDGKSGAAYYWIRKRYNESKEHAFFVNYISDLLEKRGAKLVEFNINNGPDIVFEFKKQKYCFEVETGSNLARDPIYVFRKMAFNQQNYPKCFVFVTKKKLKYRYSKMADVVTRATLMKTIAGLGKN